MSEAKAKGFTHLGYPNKADIVVCRGRSAPEVVLRTYFSPGSFPDPSQWIGYGRFVAPGDAFHGQPTPILVASATAHSALAVIIDKVRQNGITIQDIAVVDRVEAPEGDGVPAAGDEVRAFYPVEAPEVFTAAERSTLAHALAFMDRSLDPMLMDRGDYDEEVMGRLRRRFFYSVDGSEEARNGLPDFSAKDKAGEDG